VELFAKNTPCSNQAASDEVLFRQISRGRLAGRQIKGGHSMSIRSSSVALLVPLVLFVALFGAPRVSEAAVPQSVLMLAAPLAEQFGVPGSAVTSLLESGVSLESVTQLLLVKQSTDKSLDEVTNLYRKQGDDVRKAADQLGVAADRYSKEKVEAAIERARADAAEKASEKAADSAGKAVGGLLQGAP